jgi:teichuronic acid biosynthesis glycosyltransferase TuaH
MYRDHDIIMLSSSRWDDNLSSSALSLAKEFSKSNRVFYIDHPFSVKDLLCRKNRTGLKSRIWALLFAKKNCRHIKNFPTGFVAVTPMLTIPVNWLKEGRLYNFLSKKNDKILHLALRTVVKKYSINRYVFINIFDPFFFKSFPNDIKPTQNIYLTVDDISQEEYISRHGVRLEKEAIARADFTFATSKELVRRNKLFSNRVFYLPNAADISIFKRAASVILSRPEELKNATGKIICYTGVIGTRINYNLLKEIAIIHHDKTLVLVGPFFTTDYIDTGLCNHANVVFTGAKHINDLPAYLQYADVAIIPFEYNQLTKSIYPLKINEYLAAGKPVVSTAFSEDIRDFENVAYVAKTNEEFLYFIDLAIKENTMQKRVERINEAARNTWQNRVETFWSVLEGQSKVAVLPVEAFSKK